MLMTTISQVSQMMRKRGLTVCTTSMEMVKKQILKMKKKVKTKFKFTMIIISLRFKRAKMTLCWRLNVETMVIALQWMLTLKMPMEWKRSVRTDKKINRISISTIKLVEVLNKVLWIRIISKRKMSIKVFL